MTVEVGTILYQMSTTSADSIGVSWLYIIRREVCVIDGTTYTLSYAERAEIPAHSPPATASDLDPYWYTLTSLAIEVSDVVITNQWSEWADLTFPTAYTFSDEAATIEARNLHRNHCYVNREAGKAQPALSAADAFDYHVLDWRYPW